MNRFTHQLLFSLALLFSLRIHAQVTTNPAVTGTPSATLSLTNQVTGTLPVANGGTGVTTSTGTGSVVLSANSHLTGLALIGYSSDQGIGTSLQLNGSLYTNGYTYTTGYITTIGGISGVLATGQGEFGGASTDGAQIYGKGSVRDLSFFNSSGVLTASVPTGTTNLSVVGTVSASNFSASNLLCSATAPTVSGFGSSPSVPANNGTCAFTVNVGTGGTASTGTVNLPTATTGWVCNAYDVTTPASFVTSQTGGSTATATFTNYARTTGLPIAWAASDVLRMSCLGY